MALFCAGLLWASAAQARGTHSETPRETPLPEGLVLPTLDSVATDLGHDPKDFKKTVDDFATVLSQGSQSQALKRICAKDEDSCRLLKDFQEQQASAKGERKRARRRARALRVNDKNIAQAQHMDMHLLISSLKVSDENQLAGLAAKSLKEAACPRNLSAALAIKSEEYFPSPRSRALAKELFAHARQCLTEDSPYYERLFLRQGLYGIYEGDKNRAREMLLASLKVKEPTERYRSLYWLGKLDADAGAKPEENQYWIRLMAEFPLSFYSIEASVAEGKDPIETIKERKVGGLKRDVADDPELNRMIRWLEALYLCQKSSATAKWASWITRANEDDLDVEVIQYISTLKVAAGLYRSNITMLFNYFKRNPQALNEEGLKLLYPRPYFSVIDGASRGKIDTFFVLGLVRQESAFDSQAVSRVKAKGLMQIIPQTARRLASQGHRKLLDEKDNTTMGVKYLLQLGGKFNGSAELVLAAYNAGPGKVEEWLHRNPNRDADQLLWNDLIPFMETRDYVVSILRNNYLYSRLYGAPQPDTEKLFGSALVRRMLSAAANTKPALPGAAPVTGADAK